MENGPKEANTGVVAAGHRYEENAAEGRERAAQEGSR
jgi:hypothetical protein